MFLQLPNGESLCNGQVEETPFGRFYEEGRSVQVEFTTNSLDRNNGGFDLDWEFTHINQGNLINIKVNI